MDWKTAFKEVSSPQPNRFKDPVQPQTKSQQFVCGSKIWEEKRRVENCPGLEAENQCEVCCSQVSNLSQRCSDYGHYVVPAPKQIE